MLVTERAFSHVGKLYSPFGACIHKPVAALGVELCRRYDFRKLFHISRFDVNDVEALILYIEVPEIDSKVVTADEGLAVAVDGYTVDVICVSVGVSSSRYGSNHSIMVCETWQL